MNDKDQLNHVVQSLVSRVRAGDREALDRLLGVCRQHVYRWALSKTADADDADEITQTVMIRLEKSATTFRGESRFTTWLYRITDNVFADHRRTHARRTDLKARRIGPQQGEATDAVAETEDPLERIHQAHVARLIRFFFEKLPNKQREVFDLVDLQGFTPLEVSRMTGMNGSTVRAHLFKARRTIRRKILAEVPAFAEEVAE